VELGNRRFFTVFKVLCRITLSIPRGIEVESTILYVFEVLCRIALSIPRGIDNGIDDSLRILGIVPYRT
jgi:hypothetical protein